MKDNFVAVTVVDLGQLLFSLPLKTKVMLGPLMITMNENIIIRSQILDVYLE